ncbi:MAG: polysaccharide pyruvyl transferase family protein [Pseudomonadota bacterium]
MIIEIKGVEFNNKGAELMLLSIIAILEQNYDNYQLVLTPGYLLPYPQRAKLGAWQKFSFTFLGINWTWLGNLAPDRIRRLLRHFGIVVEKDIDIVLDASGFVYSDQWDASRLKHTLNHLKRIVKYKSQYIFLPQAFGPFKNQKKCQLMKQIIDLAVMVIARDNYSFNSLKTINASDKIKCFPDFTPLLAAKDMKLAITLPDNIACLIPNYKVLANKSGEFKHHYLDFFKKSISSIESMGLTAILINHEGEKDHQLCQEIIANSEIKPLYFSQLGALEIKNILGLSRLCISSRFHACISSLSQGIPTLATSWSHKYEELYSDYQCQENIIDVTDPSIDIKDKLAQVMANHSQISLRLLEQAELNKKSSKKMWSLVLGELSL